MSIDLNPTCPIVNRFADDLKLNGKSPRTLQAYCRAVRKFAEFLGHSPDSATEEQLRQYLLFLSDSKQWKSSTINVAQQALKQFFRLTCPRQWETLKLIPVQVETKLPVVISVGEVHTLLKLIEKPSMHFYIPTVYSLGLRLQEALHLQVRAGLLARRAPHPLPVSKAGLHSSSKRPGLKGHNVVRNPTRPHSPTNASVCPGLAPGQTPLWCPTHLARRRAALMMPAIRPPWKRKFGWLDRASLANQTLLPTGQAGGGARPLVYA